MRVGGRIAVVGGGVSGLAAAHRLRRLVPDAEITVIDGAARLGGALRTVELAGVALDVGAEAFLVRRPEATALVTELGLGADLIHPTSAAPTVRAGGRTVGLPTRTVLGLPASADAVAGLLSPAGRARVAAEAAMPLAWEPGTDVAVGALVRSRAGDELVDRLVDPLLGGVYAGRADALGLRATVPQVAAALDRGAGSLLAAAAAVLPPKGASRTPVFGTLRGGLGRLVEALTGAATTVRCGSPVRALVRREQGWRLELGSGEALDVDAVVLAVPAPALRRLLADPVPSAAAALARVEVASSVVVGLALPCSAALPASSGVLIASGEPQAAKAFTFSSRKWEHLRAPGVLLVRGSLGRHGEVAAVQRDDVELVAAVRADLAALTGVDAEPVATVVSRWGGGLPQYAPGHLDVVAAVEAAVDGQPGLAVAGAILHGVGIPACIATADAAAARIAAHLAAVGGMMNA
ncbi:MAG: protoporphyrinogen oxidase [Pseudonocardiaceae bacterium]